MNNNIKLSIRKTISVGLILVCTMSFVACSKKEEVKDNSSQSTSEEINETKENIDEGKDKNNKESAVAEKSGSIVTLGNTAFEIYRGNEAAASKYSDTINNHKKSLGKDVNVYNMVVPTHVEFGLPDKYEDMSNPQKPVIDKIYEGLDSEIKTVTNSL